MDNSYCAAPKGQAPSLASDGKKKKTGASQELLVWTCGLTKQFKDFIAVSKVDLTICKGDVFGLLGPNGAGKTTIIRMLLGMITPTSGQVKVFGFDPQHQHAEVMCRVSAIVETPTLYPFLTGLENLQALTLTARKVSPSKPRQVLQTMNLTNHANEKYQNYSLGMKQRLAIAAALLTDPQLIILDEPTNGLDPSGMAEIRQLITDLNKKQGTTIFLSSHLLSEVQQVCNRIAIIKNGQIVQQGLMENLLATESSILVSVQPDQLKVAWEILETHGWHGRIKIEHNFLVVDTPVQDSRKINELLARNDVYAAEIIIHNQSLEEYYLKVINENINN